MAALLTAGSCAVLTASGPAGPSESAGAAGTGITVAVIDSGFDTALLDLAGTNLQVQEPAFCGDAGGAPATAATTHPDAEHGTQMVSLVAGTGTRDGHDGARGVAPGARVLAYRFSSGDPSHTDLTCARTVLRDGHGPVRAAVDAGADIISMSWSADYPGLVDELVYAQRAGVILVAATPNGSPGAAANAHEVPLSVNGVVGVAPLGRDGRAAAFSVPGPDVDVAAPGVDFRVPSADDGWSAWSTASGSSVATAYTAGALAVVWAAYPAATGNQVIQSLVRNTAGGNGALERDDELGYGTLDVAGMLTHDPTGYPDVNPLLSDDASAYPRPADVQHPIVAPEPDSVPFRVSLHALLGAAGSASVLAVLGWAGARRRRHTDGPASR